MHRGCFVWRPAPPLSGWRAQRPGPARVCVCVPFLAGSGGRPLGRVPVRPTFAVPGLGALFVLFGPLQAGLALFVVVVGVFFSFPVAPPLFPALRVFRPGLPLALASCCPPPPACPCFSFVLLFSPRLSLAFRVFRPRVPWASTPRCPPAPPPFFFPPPFLFVFFCFFFLLLFLCFLVFLFFLPFVPCRAGLYVLGCGVCRCVLRWCCPCGCSLCGALSLLCRWLVLCGVACCVWVFAVGLGCPLLSPGGSWCRVSVVMSLSGRVARRPVVWCGASWCSAALCCVLWQCAVMWWCAVVLCYLFASLPVPVVCFLPLRICCVCSGVSCCAFPVLSALCGAVLRCAGALALCCPRRLCCFWCLVLLVPGVAACCSGSAGGSGCLALSFGVVCRLRCPCLVWPSLGVFLVVYCSPVLCPVALCCRVVLCCGALSSFAFFFPCWWRWFSANP